MLTIEDVCQRFAATMDDFDPGKHEVWALAEVVECMQRIGLALTSDRVKEDIRLLPGNILPLPAGCLRWYHIRRSNGVEVLVNRRAVGKLIQLPQNLGCQVLELDYERLAQDTNGCLMIDPLIEPALFAWLKWRWMQLRPMKDQVGELRKGSLSLVQMLKAEADDTVAEVRGLLNLTTATPQHMTGVGLARRNTKYVSRRNW